MLLAEVPYWLALPLGPRRDLYRPHRSTVVVRGTRACLPHSPFRKSTTALACWHADLGTRNKTTNLLDCHPLRLEKVGPFPCCTQYPGVLPVLSPTMSRSHESTREPRTCQGSRSSFFSWGFNCFFIILFLSTCTILTLFLLLSLKSYTPVFKHPRNGLL